MDKIILCIAVPSQIRPNTMDLFTTKAVSRRLHLLNIPFSIDTVNADISLLSGPIQHSRIPSGSNRFHS